MPFSGEHEQMLMAVARTAIRGALSGQVPAPPEVGDGFHPELHQPAGCFVSLHDIETTELRGCVGRLEARNPLLLAVHDCAISVLADPRFQGSMVSVAVRDDEGKTVWQTRIGRGSGLGGQWGASTDEQNAYIGVSDLQTQTPGGMRALRLSDGQMVWSMEPQPKLCGDARTCRA